MSTRLHLDCVGGLAGDMFIAAVSGLLPDMSEFTRIMQTLDLGDWDFDFSQRVELGIDARLLDLRFPADGDHLHHVPDIRERIVRARLPEVIEAHALAMLSALAEAEGKVHGKPVDEVHFHELAGLDLVFDLVGSATLIYLLKPDRITFSALPMGHGLIQIAHGTMPLPAPATAYLLEGLEVTDSEIQGETVTPTGAAIARNFAAGFAGAPAGRIIRQATSAGQRENPTVPNIVRAFWLEEGATLADGMQDETLLELAANIDDMNPEHVDWAMERLFAAGALDVWVQPIQMKKNRPAFAINVLAREVDSDACHALLFAETTTLGVRRRLVQRRSLFRQAETRDTVFGPVNGKAIRYADGFRWVPEYDELKRLAAETGRPLRELAARLSGENAQ